MKHAVPSEPTPISDLYRSVRLPPIRTAYDKPTAVLFCLGTGLLLLTIALAISSTWLPLSIKPVLKYISLWLYLGGLISMIASGVLSATGAFKSFGRGVSDRFDRNHTTSCKLAHELASNHSLGFIRSLRHSVQLELRIISRAPEKLPIATGFIAGLAGIASLVIRSPESSESIDAAEVLSLTNLATPELAWVVVGAGVGVIIARALVHDTHDRLMRAEATLEKAEGVAGRLPCMEPASASGAT